MKFEQLVQLSGDLPAQKEISQFSLEKRIVLRNCGRIDPENVFEYIARVKGYRGLAKCLQMSPAEVISMLRGTGLRGRGGGGFLTADKWDVCGRTAGTDKYVVCNAVDSDPDSETARTLLEGDPHAILEGMLIAAYAVGATHCIIAAAEEFQKGTACIKQAVAQTKEYNLSGNKILESDFSAEVEIKTLPRTMVIGEETALIRSLEGKQAIPYIRPPYPATAGLDGKPTLVNNIETLANVAAVFSGQFVPSDFVKGTRVITVCGLKDRKLIVEVPLGTTFGQLLEAVGENEFRALQFGGPTGAFFGLGELARTIDYESLKDAGSIMGSGTLKLFSKDTCAVEMAARNAEYLRSQSCGKCIFCREGTYQIAQVLKEVNETGGRANDLEMLTEISGYMKTGTICGLGQTAGNPFLSSMKYFPEDYESHIKYKRCLYAND